MMQPVMHSHYVKTPVGEGQPLRIRDCKRRAETVTPCTLPRPHDRGWAEISRRDHCTRASKLL